MSRHIQQSVYCRSVVVATAAAAAAAAAIKPMGKRNETKTLFCANSFPIVVRIRMSLLFIVAQVWRAFNFMRSYNTRTADDDATTAITQAPFVPWFPRPTYAKSAAVQTGGFVSFLVLQVARDLRHLFKKQHPDTSVALSHHPKPVHYTIHGPVYFPTFSLLYR
jgi:hypothetical protein